MLGTLDSLCNHTLRSQNVDREKLLQTVYALLMTGLVADEKKETGEKEKVKSKKLKVKSDA